MKVHGPETMATTHVSPSPQRPHPDSSLRRWIALGLASVGLLFGLKTHLGFVLVDGDSMLPTFQSGDLLLIHKRAYRQAPPARGDIVVSRFRSELIVKRIVGLPSETVEVVDGKVRVNGSPIPERYPLQPGTLNVRPGELMPERFAVLGDNRAGSDYQLFFGVVAREGMVGRTVLAFRLRGGERHCWIPQIPEPVGSGPT